MKWLDEVAKIRHAATLHNVHDRFIMAIRRAEHGRDGLAFGIEIKDADTYDKQLNDCCNTVAHALAAYPGNPFQRMQLPSGLHATVYSMAFIQLLARAYCPIGAENDPHHLNKNWLSDVENVYADMLLEDPTDTHFCETWDA